MATSPEVVHLLAARAELHRQRSQIDHALAGIENVLVMLVPRAPVDEVRQTALTDKPTAAPTATPTVREAITKVVAEAGGPIKMNEIIDGVSGLGVVTQPDTVRSIVSKMLKEYKLTRIGRATYLARPVPTNAESPADTGLSVVPAPTEEGRTDHAETGDDNDLIPGWHHSDGRGTPSIAEG